MISRLLLCLLSIIININCNVFMDLYNFYWFTLFWRKKIFFFFEKSYQIIWDALRASCNLEQGLHIGTVYVPNSTLHIKRSSMPPRGPDISSIPPRIDNAGTSLMNSMLWHMPMIGRRLIPRISISVRICTLPHSLI